MMDLFVQKVYAAGISAPTTAKVSTVDKLLSNIVNQVVTPLIYLMAAAAVLYFVWGVMLFIKNADNPTERKVGYDHMIWGVIGIFIMVSARGIIYIILSTLGLN